MGNKKKTSWNFHKAEIINFKIDVESGQLKDFFFSICYKMSGSNRHEYPKIEGFSLVWESRLKPDSEVKLTQKNGSAGIDLKANYFNAPAFGVFAFEYYPIMYVLFVGNVLFFIQKWAGFSEQVGTILNILLGWVGLFASIFIIARILKSKRRRAIPKALEEIKASLEGYCKIQESGKDVSEKKQNIVDCIPEF